MTTVSPDIAVENPYPGLRPFEPADAHLFFGRTEQTYELLRRLEEHRFVAVLGLSGSGKSSLVRAGAIPLLRRGALIEGGPKWHIATMRPGADPMNQLTDALDKALGPDSSRAGTLRRSSFGLIHAARTGRSSDENLLVFVDQFEEIFRQPRSASSDFVRLLLTAIQEAQPDFRLYVVLTMRTDYLGDCAQFRDLPEALNDSQYLVPRLTPEQSRVAIVEPAKASGGRVDGELLQQLMLDAGDDPDQLPILQHLLMRMWALKGGRERITLDEYTAAGKWEKAIDNHGEELLNGLPPHQKQIAKRIFQRVTELGGRERDRRRLTLLSELVAICVPTGTEADVRAVVEHFSRPGADFLTSPDWNLSQDPLVDITHESLIRQWTELNKWAREESESGEWYRRIEDRLRTKGSYLSGAELDSALSARESGNWSESWAVRYTDVPDSSNPPFLEVIQFLNASDRKRSDEIKRHRRTQTLIVIAAIVFAILAVISAYFWWSAKTKAREARSRELAAYSVESLATDPELSIALATQAVKATLKFNRPVLTVAENALHRAILESAAQMTLRGHSDYVSGVAFSPDGKRLATAGSDDAVQVYAVDIQTLLSLAKQRVMRPLTSEECKRYFPGETCPVWP